MSKLTQASEKQLWQPLSNQQAETVSGGSSDYIRQLANSLKSAWCNVTHNKFYSLMSKR
ncbi:MAG: hypothetical protein AAF821_14295 [Cyanobacteria bacterium P01_D01_bin.156]